MRNPYRAIDGHIAGARVYGQPEKLDLLLAVRAGIAARRGDDWEDGLREAGLQVLAHYPEFSVYDNAAARVARSSSARDPARRWCPDFDSGNQRDEGSTATLHQ